MQKTILNQIFLLISLIPCCNTINAMEKRTQKTTTATSTTVHRHALRSKGKDNLFHNSNLITRANASPKIARAKAAPRKSLKSLPLPLRVSPKKNKKQTFYNKEHNIKINIFFPSTEESSSSADAESASSADETDPSSIDVFSPQEESLSLEIKNLPSEGLSFEDFFTDTDMHIYEQQLSFNELNLDMCLEDLLRQ